MANGYEQLLQQFSKTAEQARLSNLSRQQQIESIFNEIIRRYEPGGAFGRGYEALLQRQKVQDVGRTAQRDIGRGMYGIRPYEAEWEATTGAEARLKLEDIRMQRLSGAQTGLASFLERIEQPYPDYGMLMQLAQVQGQASTGGGSVWGNRRPLPTLAGSSGPTYAAGESPVQLELAERNKRALEERQKANLAAAEVRKDIAEAEPLSVKKPHAGAGKFDVGLPYYIDAATYYKAKSAWEAAGKKGIVRDYV